ncbi:MAG: hypothetical protein WAM30_10245 [Candidatus Dormiibacterota bacterium]
MDVESVPPRLRWVLSTLSTAVRTREPAVADTVRKLREEFPDRSPEELAHILIRRQRRVVAGTAAASGAFAVVPGLSTLVVLGVGAGQSLYALEREVELVLAIGLLFGHLPAEHDARTLEALIVIGLAGGALKLRDDVVIAGSQRIATHVLTTYPQVLLSRAGGSLVTRALRGAVAAQLGSVVARAAPLALGVAVGATFDWMTMTALGRSALRYYGPAGPAAKRAVTLPSSLPAPPDAPALPEGDSGTLEGNLDEPGRSDAERERPASETGRRRSVSRSRSRPTGRRRSSPPRQ